MNGQELLNGDEYTTHRLKRLGTLLALRTKLLEPCIGLQMSKRYFRNVAASAPV